MPEKKAFIFDTNFIIQNQELDEALDKLKEQYSVYVSQVSINERIAQQCREVKAKFEEAEKCNLKFSHFASVVFKKTYAEEKAFYEKGVQKRYEKYFGEHIIPFAEDGEMLRTIIDRANQKLPPFSSDKNASDKGFKDCLLWLSILTYFKDNGEDEVIFVTDDKSAFRNNVDFLQNEFRDVTGKTIAIHPNAYYRETLIQPEKAEPSVAEIVEEFPNLEAFREEVAEAVGGLLGEESESYYGDPDWLQTFTTSVPFDKEYAKTFFSGLQTEMFEHLFEESIPASVLLNFDGRVTDGDIEIPMQSLEKVLKVYKAVLKNYPQYCDQFYEAAAKVLNRNYYKPSPSPFDIIDENGDLPF